MQAYTTYYPFFLTLSVFATQRCCALFCFALLGEGVSRPLACKTNEFDAINPSQVVALRQAL